MGEGVGLRVYQRGRLHKREDQKTTQRKEGRGKGEGMGWVKGLLIRGISEESPTSNIKDESDRSEDDPRRSEGI